MLLRTILVIATCLLAITTALECLDGPGSNSKSTYKCHAGHTHCFSYEADGTHVDNLFKTQMEALKKAATRDCDGFGICKKLGLEAGGEKYLNIFELKKSGVAGNVEIAAGVTERDLLTKVGSVAEILLLEKDPKLQEKKLTINMYQTLRFRYSCCNTDKCNTYKLKH